MRKQVFLRTVRFFRIIKAKCLRVMRKLHFFYLKVPFGFLQDEERQTDAAVY